MIPQTEVVRQSTESMPAECREPAPGPGWQQSLVNVIRDLDELLTALQLSPDRAPYDLSHCRDFPLRVPREFVARMQPGNWHDPLLLQVLPLARELAYQPGFEADPLGEASANPVPGLIHKYRGRVLVIVSGGCGIHCRYCFRRHFPYAENNPGRADWEGMLDYIRADTSIHEVILSGGDPLVASNRLLADLVRQLAAIPHLQTLRVHTRLPIVIPQRVDPDCLAWLTTSRLKPVVVVHANHANEIDSNVRGALLRLRAAGVTTLNQAVLLAGVNDSLEQLIALSEQLFDAGTLPYYLHLLDRVDGAADFDVPEHRAIELVQGMLANLPGYLVPRLVREVAGAASKIPLPAWQ